MSIVQISQPRHIIMKIFKYKFAVEIARTVETTNGCGDNFLSASLIDLKCVALFAENPIYETKKIRRKVNLSSSKTLKRKRKRKFEVST